MELAKAMPIEPRYLDLFCEYLYNRMGIYIEDRNKSLLAEKLTKLMQDGGLQNSADFALMQTNMNKAIDELRKSLGEIASSSQQIAMAATETSAASRRCGRSIGKAADHAGFQSQYPNDTV